MDLKKFTELANKHLTALEIYKMDKNGNTKIQIFGIEELYKAINYTPCCTELKAFKNDETVALDGTLEVKIVNIESKVLVKVIEDDTLMWVKKDRLKREYSF